ncbi:MAG: monovalent cation/H+ antiporter subunit D [Dongiaceae bacterium]
MSRTLDHLMIAPVLLPLAAAAVMLLLDERRRVLKATINLASTLALVGIAIALMRMADGSPIAGATARVGAYPLGDWPTPFGIVMVVDRLSALMLLLTSVLASAALLYSLARWHRAGAYYHSLFQFLLMGLNGAFLTGDLFNLFVFFELLLAASYGLVLHGSNIARVKAGLHYIAINLAASMLFLIGVSLIYGVTGTLNMADLATRIPAIAPENRMLLEAGAAILGVAFLVKAGIWPLGFWLPRTYSAASAPVAALFAIMTKMGIYAVLRLWLLLFGAEAGASAGLGGDWLLIGGMATVAFGAIGMLAAQDTARLASYCVLVSSGTLLAAIGMDQVGITSGALFYLVNSTLVIGALFLLIELVERGREAGADMLAVTIEAFGDEDEAEEGEEVGFAIPATMAVLGLAFIACALGIAGLPPLPGFIAKFAMLTAALNPSALPGTGPVSAATWALLAMLLLSGLATLLAMTRTGIRVLWASADRAVPRVRAIEIAPVAVLLLLCLVLTVEGGMVMRYMQSTAQSLHAPHDYIRSVLSPAEPPGDPGEGGA